jgi:hypothetical protein
MVRSRSEANLNRILFDLCTTPEIRSKHEHIRNNQRQHHPPLPTLKPIRSNSCSDLSKTSQNVIQIPLSSLDDHQTNTLDMMTPVRLSPLEPKNSIEKTKSPTVPLMPMESTGFTVQTTSYFANRSLSLFETTSINTTKKIHEHSSLFKREAALLENSSLDDKPIKTTSLLSTITNDWKQQDYTSRLRDRLKSRGHLRKFFLS